MHESDDDVEDKGQEAPHKDDLAMLVDTVNAHRHADSSPAGFFLLQKEGMEPRLYFGPWAIAHVDPEMNGRAPVAIGEAAIRAFMDQQK